MTDKQRTINNAKDRGPLAKSLWPALRGVMLGCAIVDSATGIVLIPALSPIRKHHIDRLKSVSSINITLEQ